MSMGGVMMIERHVKLIRLMLINRNQFLNADEIARYLNVSNRTARNDIQYINSEILDDLIVSVKGRGYKLNQSLYSVQQIETIVTDFTNKESELLIKLGYQLLMYQQPLTSEAIGKTFHLTKAEVTDYINKIKAWCISFDVNIQITKKKGITVNGSEMNIRNAILHLNQLSENVKTVDALILNEIPKTHVETMTQIIEANLNKHDLYTSKIRITQLLIHLIIIFKRNSDDGQSWVVDDTSYQIAQQCINEINKALGYSLSEETAELFSFIKGDSDYQCPVCKQYGCMENEISGLAISRKASHILNKHVSTREAIEMYLHQTHSEITEMIDEVLILTQQLYTNLFNIFNINNIVLGGSVTQSKLPYKSSIENYAQKHYLIQNSTLNVTISNLEANVLTGLYHVNK